MLYFNMPSFEAIRTLIMSDLILSITLGMSILLAVFSLFSGLWRLDFLPIWKPLTLTQVGLAILLALMLKIFEQSPYANLNFDFLPTTVHLTGISFLPLIIITIAYGPSIGLLAVALFLALTPPAGVFNWRDAVIMLEFVVLGWWAIYPSSFQQRWAGPANLLISYILVWGTAGSALFHSQGLDIRDWRVHYAYHQNYLPALLISILFLFLPGPKLFKLLFANSRIQPKQRAQSSQGSTTDLAVRQVSANPNAPKHQRTALQKPKVVSLTRQHNRVRSLSKNTKRVAMRSFRDQDR